MVIDVHTCWHTASYMNRMFGCIYIIDFLPTVGRQWCCTGPHALTDTAKQRPHAAAPAGVVEQREAAVVRPNRQSHFVV